LDAILTDKDIARAIKGVGVQWAGKNALPKIHDKHPDLLIYQSEQECGDGANTWAYTGYCWQLMKHYFRNGASAYMYWNISLEMNTPSTWGWAQNSLVSVDPVAKTYRFNHDYYLMKHLTHYVDLGAKSLETAGTCDNALAFVNPDGSVVVLLRNESSLAQKVQVRVRNREVTVELPPDSIATLFEKAS
jgi:glucosylceramidase